MEFTFTPLSDKHFSLIHQWVNTPHVNKWYGEEKPWPLEKVDAKYRPYVTSQKNINAYIIEANHTPIGFVQVYTALDQPREGYDLKNVLSEKLLTQNLAAIDFYIGAEDYVGKGFGTAALNQFLKQTVFKVYDACLADPVIENSAAIKCYERCGFEKITQLQTEWPKGTPVAYQIMVREKS